MILHSFPECTSYETEIDDSAESGNQENKENVEPKDVLIDIEPSVLKTTHQTVIEENLPGPSTSNILKNAPTNTSNRWNLKKRRRTVTSEEKKNTLDSFNKLAETKMQVADLQKECQQVDLMLKKEESAKKAEEWEIRRKVTDLDVQIKNVHLDEIKEEQVRKRKLFELEVEQQKLKTEILKCELNIKLKESLLSSKK